MTLNEAIEHAEEVAEEHESGLKVYENLGKDRSLFKKEESCCKECADEHRQLAEWLKDYKRLLEQETVSRESYEHEYFLRKEFEIKIDKLERQFDKVRAEVEEIETYDGIYIDRAYVLEIIDKYKAESEE